MKFTCTVEIDLPVDRVVEVFQDRDNYQKWQPDLLGMEHLSGTPGQPGSQCKMRFKSGKHEFDLFETVTVNDLPHEFSGEYVTHGVCSNTMKNTFTSIGDNRTRYDAKVEYEFHGFVVRVMSWLMPGKFKQQVEIYLQRFKEYAERTVNRPDSS